MEYFSNGLMYVSSELRSKQSTFIITDSGYGCPQCGNNYKHKTSLYKHLKYECQKEKQFECWFCKKRFARKGHLQSHCKYVHDINPNKLAVEIIKPSTPQFDGFDLVGELDSVKEYDTANKSALSTYCAKF